MFLNENGNLVFNEHIFCTRTSPAGHGGAAGLGNTRGNDAETHRSLHGRAWWSPRVHLMPATRVSFRLFTTRSDPYGGLGRSVWGAGCPKPSHVMRNLEFQKDRMFAHTFNLSLNSIAKSYILMMMYMYTRTSFFDYLGTWPTLRRKCACSAIIY